MKNIPLTVVSILVLVAGFALAQPAGEPGPAAGAPPMDPPPMPEMPAMAGVMGIAGMMPPDMTPEQMEKCDGLRVSHLKTVMPIRTDIQVAEIELEALWRADEPDAGKIVAKVKEISGLKGKLELAMVNHRLDMYKIFTPEQRKAMKKMGMGRGMMGRGMGMRGMGRGMKGMGQAGPSGQRGPQNCQDCQMH